MRIPERMLEAIERYRAKGVIPGDFLTAVLCNDLTQAVARADDENIHLLPDYVRYLYNNIPSGAWGSRDRVKAWNESFKG